MGLSMMDLENNFCWICGSRLYGNDLENLKHEICDKIISYLPFLKSGTITFPQKCCKDCADTIANWDIFYQRIKDVEEGQRTKKVIEENKVSTENKTYEDLAKTSKCRIKSRTHLKYKCWFCEYSSNIFKNFNKHLIDEHCDLIFCCDICSEFRSRTDLLSHMTEHANNSLNCNKNMRESQSAYKCKRCAKEFTSLTAIEYHMNAVHGKTKNFKCKKCDGEFSCKRILLNHIRSKHSNETRLYKCTDCLKQFKTDSTLYAHRKTHLNLKPYACDHCSKMFRYKHHLHTHLLQHKTNKVLTFGCNLCKKKFAARSNLTKHKKIHNVSIMDFICHICGVKLLQKRYLTQHMKRVHLIQTGEKSAIR